MALGNIQWFPIPQETISPAVIFDKSYNKYYNKCCNRGSWVEEGAHRARGNELMTRIMGVTKARVGFTEVVNEADNHGEPIYLTNFNEPRAVLIGYKAWEALVERLEDLEDAVTFHMRRGEPSRSIEEFLVELEKVEENDKAPLPATASAIS